MAAKKASKSKAAKTRFAGQCLTLLKKKAGARNLSTADGNLTSLVLLAIIARGAAVTAAKKAFERIKEFFVDWNELRVTRVGQIAFYLDGIKEARAKARSIGDVLGNIFEGTHDLGLHFLEGASAEEARDFLMGLGALDDAIVDEIILSGRAFFHMSADTDVARVARRLELVGRNTTPGGFERDVVEMLGDERAYQLTFLLKELAEGACTVHSPQCEECPLKKVCPSSRA
jgi:endonuclease III